MAKRFLDIEVQQQIQSLFCWCAVCVSVVKFYWPASVVNQETFSEKLLGGNANRACHPFVPLEASGILHASFNSQVGYQKLKDEIDSGFPVVVSLRYFVGSHLMLITGYDNEKIRVSDPMSGADDICSYEEFIAGYQNGIYHWAETYFTRPLKRMF